MDAIRWIHDNQMIHLHTSWHYGHQVIPQNKPVLTSILVILQCVNYFLFLTCPVSVILIIGETAISHQEPVRFCSSLEASKMCDQMTCLGCNNYREVSAQMVRGTILVRIRYNCGKFPMDYENFKHFPLVG